MDKNQIAQLENELNLLMNPLYISIEELLQEKTSHVLDKQILKEAIIQGDYGFILESMRVFYLNMLTIDFESFELLNKKIEEVYIFISSEFLKKQYSLDDKNDFYLKIEKSLLDATIIFLEAIETCLRSISPKNAYKILIEKCDFIYKELAINNYIVSFGIFEDIVKRITNFFSGMRDTYFHKFSFLKYNNISIENFQIEFSIYKSVISKSFDSLLSNINPFSYYELMKELINEGFVKAPDFQNSYGSYGKTYKYVWVNQDGARNYLGAMVYVLIERNLLFVDNVITLKEALLNTFEFPPFDLKIVEKARREEVPQVYLEPFIKILKRLKIY